MPMPTADSEWPPKRLAPAYRAYQDWDAWYVGDPDKLRTVYAGRGTGNASLRPSQRKFPGQYAGGVVGRFSRWLWGAPQPDNEQDGRLHGPLPADLATVSANQLFAELPTFSHDDEKTQEWLNKFVENGLAGVLLHAQEANAVLGDVYLRPIIDEEAVAGRAMMTAVHADGAIPTIRWGVLTEVTFWQCLYDDGGTEYIRLLEHHDVKDGAGRITYALYKGSVDKLGTRIKDLKSFPETAYLADIVDTEGTQNTGLDRLDVVRVPNSGPQRRWRTHAGLKYLGRSDFDGAEQFFDRYDTLWTGLMKDFRLAQSRILAPDYMLKNNGPGGGATFDADQEVYRAMQMMPDAKNSGGQGITLNQFDIRVEKHLLALEAVVRTVLRHSGFSPSTLGDDGDSATAAPTATEVNAKKDMSLVTRGNRAATWKQALADYIEIHMELEAKRFSGPPPQRPDIDFGDGTSESAQSVAQTIQLLDAAGAISLELKVRMAHPEWDKKAQDEEIERLQKEREEERMANADEFAGGFGGGGGSSSGGE